MVVVRLSWYERFLNNLNNTNLYVGKGKNYKPEREQALKDFLKEMEEECYARGYEDGMKVIGKSMGYID